MTSHRPRLLRAAAASICLALGGVAATESPAIAASTKTCNVRSSPKYPNANPGGYFTSLKVRGVSCSSGKRLMVAFYKCRRKGGQGVQGRCRQSRVNGLRCSERRPASGNNGSEYNATVTCSKGSKRVVHTYQQNLG